MAPPPPFYKLYKKTDVFLLANVPYHDKGSKPETLMSYGLILI